MKSKKSHALVRAPLLEQVPVSVIIGRLISPKIILGITSKELASYKVMLPPHMSEYYRESNNLTKVVTRRKILTELAATYVGGLDNLRYVLGQDEVFKHYLTETQTLRLEKVTRLRGTPIVRI